MTDIDDGAPGWDAITAATDVLYAGQEPKHVGTLVPWDFGGPDPLRGISAWDYGATCNNP